jgi:hypothetical protein
MEAFCKKEDELGFREPDDTIGGVEKLVAVLVDVACAIEKKLSHRQGRSKQNLNDLVNGTSFY